MNILLNSTHYKTIVYNQRTNTFYAKIRFYPNLNHINLQKMSRRFRKSKSIPLQTTIQSNHLPQSAKSVPLSKASELSEDELLQMSMEQQRAIAQKISCLHKVYSKHRQQMLRRQIFKPHHNMNDDVNGVVATFFCYCKNERTCYCNKNN